MLIELFTASEGSAEMARQSSRIMQVEHSATVDQIVESIDSFLQNLDRILEFELDETSGLVAITVIDAKRHEIIRRISPEQTLRLMARARESATWEMPA